MTAGEWRGTLAAAGRQQEEGQAGIERHADESVDGNDLQPLTRIQIAGRKERRHLVRSRCAHVTSAAMGQPGVPVVADEVLLPPADGSTQISASALRSVTHRSNPMLRMVERRASGTNIASERSTSLKM